MAFSKGQKVQLISGGPVMAVSAVGDYSHSLGPEDGVLCVWFDTIKGVQKVTEHVFDAAVLVLYEPPAPRERRSSVSFL